MTDKTIQLGIHYHRSLTEATVISFNKETMKVEMSLVSVGAERGQELRGRLRLNGTQNLQMEAMIVHRSGTSTASYRITSSRYGINIVPWALVSREDMRKDLQVLAFDTADAGRVLTLARDTKSIVSVCMQYEDENEIIHDAKIPKIENTGISSAFHDDDFFIGCSEQDFDIVLRFHDLGGEANPDEILSQFMKDRTFSL